MVVQEAQIHAEIREKLLVDAFNEEQAMINQTSGETVRVDGTRQALELLMEQTDELVSDDEDLIAVTEEVNSVNSSESEDDSQLPPSYTPLV